MKSQTLSRWTLLLALSGNGLVHNPASAATSRLNQAKAWERADADADGALSRQEARRMPRLARHFDVIDGDRDGAITGAEVRLWRESLRVRKPVQPARGVDEFLRLADRDGDGRISRSEFARALPRHASRFDGLDLDRDGRLGRGELEQWLAARRAVRTLK